VVAVVVIGLTVAGARTGYPVTQPRLLSGAAWLASGQVGQLTLLDGASAEVAAQVRVAAPGDRLEVVQQGPTAYAVDRTAGSIRRVNGTTFEVSPPVVPIPDARDGLRAFAGSDSLYALDTNRGVLTGADPVTLAPLGKLLPIAAQVDARSTVLDGDGRLWMLDPATGDLIWTENSRRHVRRGLAPAGAGLLTLAGGNPVLVDTQHHTATTIDPHTGAARDATALDLRSGDRVAVSGSPHADRLYVVSARGVLAVCDLNSSGCGDAILLGSDSSELGAAVETAGRLFIPDYTDGRVLIVDLASARVLAKAQVLSPPGRFELLTRDGVVFFNDPDTERAGVIRLDGGVKLVAKYDPSDPNRGLTHAVGQTNAPEQTDPSDQPDPANQPNPPDSSTNRPPDRPSRPNPPNNPPGALPTLRIVLSADRPLVGQLVTLKVVANGSPTLNRAQWTFGDGRSGDGLVAAHSWSKAGTFQVSARATFRDGRGASTSLTITVADKPRLTVQVSGTGVVVGGGISCPPTCGITIEPGRAVALTAQPGPGSVFGAWGGACGGTATSCSLVMDAGKTVTADFRVGTLPAPVQVSPASGTLFTNFPRVTTLTWQGVAGATGYHVEVQCDTCGSTPWVTWTTASTAKTSFTFTWVGDNVGRWRVTAVGPNGAGRSSGFWTFRYRTAPAQLAAPVQVSPANGAVFTNFPRTTTLRWQAVPGAVKYAIEVQCDTCGSTPWVTWISTTTTQTSYTFTWVGAQSGRWRVTAISANGTRGLSSRFWTFRYTV
jgi:hypothetical protein